MKPKERKQATQALNEVFDHYKGATISKQALVSMVAQKLSIKPQHYSETMEALDRIVQEEANEGKLRIKRGIGGGVARVCDEIPTPPVEATKKELDDVKFAMHYLEGYSTAARRHKHGSTVRELGQALTQAIKTIQG